MLFHRASVISFLSLAFSIPSLSFASDSFTQLPQLFQGAATTASLQRAYEAVHQDAFVQELLREENTHSLSIDSRVSGYGVETTKFQHFYKGLEVMGSMTFHHATANG